MSSPLISVIIVSFNTCDILRKCLEQLFLVAGNMTPEVIVVDNASRDASADMVERDFPAVRLIRSHTNLGFAAANNLALEVANGDFLLLLNPDALVEPECLQRSLAYMEDNPCVGMGGGRLVDGEGRWQPSARQFPSLMNELLVLTGLAARYPKSRFFGRFDRTWDNSGKVASVDWVPGAYTLIRRKALDQTGGFDERFFLYYEEVDLCRRFHQGGWQIQYWPDVLVRHTGGESSKTVEHLDFSSSGSQLTLWRMRSELLYYRKHHGKLVAFLVARLEGGWHRLRALRATLQGKMTKASDSRQIATLMRQAWKDTDGGQHSPVRPW